MSLWYSLTEYPLLEAPLFVGLENYRNLLGDAVFGRVLVNTLLFTAISVPLATVLALFVAAVLHGSGRGLVVYRAAVFVPSLVPAVAAAMIWLWLYNGELGLINRALEMIPGVTGPDWLGHGGWAMTALIIMSLWTIGPSVVIYLAALRDVPAELLEAADLDGLGPVRRFWHVTLPLISPVVLFNVIVGTINAWQVFVVPYVMTGGGPDRATYFYSMYLYDLAFDYGQMGYASALAWVQMLIILAITIVMLLASRRLVYERVA